jgi:riboflavin synthase alpha subunit
MSITSQYPSCPSTTLVTVKLAPSRVIAYTQGKVVTAAKKPGDLVNVEIDIVGKYVEKSFHPNIATGLSDEDSYSSLCSTS